MAGILSYFQTSKLLQAFNATSVSLVPKVQNPNNIREYRPISYCSVVYKCITKILANRFVITVFRSSRMTTKIEWSRHRSFLYGCDRSPRIHVFKLRIEIPNLNDITSPRQRFEILSSGVRICMRKD